MKFTLFTFLTLLSGLCLAQTQPIPNQLSKDQIEDSVIVEEDELSSTGVLGTSYYSSLTVSSVVTGTRTVTFVSADIYGARVQVNDFLKIVGGSAAGTYTVTTLVDYKTVIVAEAIPTANSGTASFYYRSGAKITGFDNSVNGFTANTVQSAIEEAKQNSEGFPRAGLPLTNNGTVGSGAWISYSELIATPRILFPVKIRIKEITWVNTNVSLGAFNFEFYKNGQVDPTNKVFTYTAPAGDRTAGYGYYVWATNLDFNAGDSLYIKYVKPSGTSLSDLALIVWIARIP